MGLLNISCPFSHPFPMDTPDKTTNLSERECSKKFVVQQGRSTFNAQSILSVCEHGKKATMSVRAASAKPGNATGGFFQHSLLDITSHFLYPHIPPSAPSLNSWFREPSFATFTKLSLLRIGPHEINFLYIQNWGSDLLAVLHPLKRVCVTDRPSSSGVGI